MSITASDRDQVSLKTWIGVFGTVLGAFMAVLDIQITNSSLRDIQAALGATLEEGSWISTSYLVAEIVVIPLTGWLSQIFSVRRYLLVNASLFILFSILCAFAWNLPSMIVFRALQGFTGGVLIPMAFTVLLTTLPPSKQPTGMALFGITATFAPSIGPTFGGWLTENFSWHYVFYINLIPGVLLLTAVWYAIDSRPMQLDRLRDGDWGGVIAMAIGLGSFQVVLEEGSRKDWFSSDLIVRLAVIAVIFLSIFFWIELTRRQPFIDLRLIKERNFGLASVINVALGLGLYGSVYILPLYLGQIQGYNALQIGEVLMWVGFPQLLVIPFVPRLMKIVDVRLLIGVGVSLFAVSCFMNSTFTNLTGMDQLRTALLVRAAGQPLIMVPLSTVATAGLAPNQAGSASGLFNMMRNLGGSIGIAAIATLLTQRQQFHSNRLGESISNFNPATQERLNQLTQYFVSRGSDLASAQNQALAAIDNVVRREAYIQAFNDCFYFIGFALLVSGIAVLFFKKVKAEGVSAGH
ncbi:drug resistance transporter, EmrB/QacA subfamily protein [Leptolyngbya boryana NIES-2135]|uniref:Drug resistance transporter, EmrB/QacA subfamily protein n=1 Tax=Leptolyngbya boryana NIES-2135 TaxID=1973484 RepID=A0A1Z4J9Y5_LEPBY|nr:MDR family MFS transporter [Leptolyngbya boryana]ULP30503.1 multidrug efflux MFS transporter [Leptolyngbya boryana IU 594]BAS54403.1 Drug resistance transporter, EmrB/QacA subfamily [Leptolyngbya boryana IAM M-101]BAS60751.1 Drug resistance transporter, EmrB/QacA subfamily [Leptolyngbya boryana dg5]BAY53540.1 drug resistance transporter, EmrB/QacA subfamily protein [Leptolyngbya boryana NIES-2135]